MRVILRYVNWGILGVSLFLVGVFLIGYMGIDIKNDALEGLLIRLGTIVVLLGIVWFPVALIASIWSFILEIRAAETWKTLLTQPATYACWLVLFILILLFGNMI